ncbi:MAG: phosphoribosylanthranilate isomerase [Candidatus Margulisiibacteriota bacterium]
MKIKICGITNLEDAQNAVSLGADAIGYIFVKESPRYITPEKAEEISLYMPPFVHIVGVFVDQSKEEIDEITCRCRLDLLQLHGNETPEFCLKMSRRVVKAFPIRELADLNPIPAYQGYVSGVLLDTKSETVKGGTGKSFDWGIALKAKDFDIPIILAGGINAGNINKAIKLVNPYAVDLSSGVEVSPGVKDYNKMQDVIRLAQSL